jgi:CheY-like chemotaxis protein
MVHSRELAAAVQWLRRYARMLSASRGSGDALVAAVLESLAELPPVVAADGGCALRVALHRALAAACSEPRALSVADMPPLDRQAALLVEVEGFASEDAARILGLDAPRLAELIDADARARAREAGGDVLVLDAEALVTLDVADILELAGHRVVGMARTHADALALARAQRPDLVVATGRVTRLHDGARQLETAETVRGMCGAEMLVLSAYPEALLKGDPSEPAFLLGKPFAPAALALAASQALAARGSRAALTRSPRASFRPDA